MKKIVAICACPMGVAHTYMAADAIEDAANCLGYKVKVETQGASGIEDKLSLSDIKEADLIIIASAVKISQSDRLSGYEDKTFKPNNSVTRGEFVKILNNVFGLTKSSGIEFTYT